MKLEEENERLRQQLNDKGLTVNVSIDDIDCVKEYLNYLKSAIEAYVSYGVDSYDEFKQKSRQGG
jgi:hypothetical protein